MEEVVWGIHAGRTGEAHSLFFAQNCIALGWSESKNKFIVGSARQVPWIKEADEGAS